MNNQKGQSSSEKKAPPNPIAEELQKNLQDLKQYQLSKYCAVGSYLDVIDNRETWCVGKILSVDPKGILCIKFDGWSDKYKEYHMIGSKKIDSFRKWTVPFTGGVKSTMREDLTPEIIKIEVNQQFDTMATLQNDEFAISDVHQFTQYYRGRLFVLIDSILSSSKPFPDKEIPLYIEFMQTYLHLFLKYIKFLPTVLSSFIEASYINKSLFLVNPKVAIAASYPECFYSVYTIFGGEIQRCQKFYKNNKFDQQVQISQMFLQKREKDYSPPDQAVGFMSYFGTLDGFEALLELLSFEVRPTADLVYLIPIHLLKLILDIFNLCLPYMVQAKQTAYAKIIKKKVVERLNRLSDRELKDLDTKLVRNTILLLGLLLRRVLDSQHDQEEIDRLDIRFSIRQIKCPFLEKKIIGIGYLKSLVNKNNPLVKQSYSNSESTLGRAKLKDYLEKEQALEALLSPENFHPEILKRSIDTLNFLNEENALLESHLDMLWKLSENKHEADLAAIYFIVVELSKSLPEKSLDLLYGFIHQIPFDSYSELIIDLLKNFSINASSSLNSSKSEKNNSNQFSNLFIYLVFKMKTAISQQFPYFGLLRLWNTIQDSSKAPGSLVNGCVEALSEILRNQFFSSQKEQFILQCVENLKTGNSVAQSLQLIIVLLKNYSPNGSYIMGVVETSIDTMILKANKEVPLLEAVVRDFDIYLKQVQQKCKQLDEKSGDDIIVGKCTHAFNIDVRLDFISIVGKILRQNKKDLTIDQVKKLWKSLVNGAVTPFEKNKFLNHLIKKNEVVSNQSQKIIHVSVLDEGLVPLIVEQIFGDSDLTKNFQIDREIFDCFKNLFVSANVKSGAFQLNNQELFLVQKFDSIVGKEVLWALSLNCTNAQVLEEVRLLIVGIHLRKTTKSSESRLKMWSRLQEKCQELLQKSSSPQIQAHIILIMKTFLQEYEGIDYFLQQCIISQKRIEGRMTFGEKKQEISINILLSQSQVILNNNSNLNSSTISKKTIKLPGQSSLLRLRKEIAKEFRLNNKDFDMQFVSKNFIISRSQEEEYSVDCLSFNEGKLPSIQVVNVKDGNTNTEEIIQFKNALASSLFSEKLLEFLSSNGSEEVVNNAWDVLNLLPKNPKIVKKFQNIEKDDVSANQWNEMLPQNCFRKLLYCLQIISGEFISSEQKLRKEQDSRCLAFLKKGGLKQIVNIYLSMNSNQQIFEKPFNFYCLSAMIEVIGGFIKNFFATNQRDFLNFNKQPITTTEFLKQLIECTLKYINFGIYKSESLFSTNPWNKSIISQSVFMNTSVILNNTKIQNDNGMSTNKVLSLNYLLFFYRNSFQLLSSCFSIENSLFSIYLRDPELLSFKLICSSLYLIEEQTLRQQIKESLWEIINLDTQLQSHFGFQKLLSLQIQEQESNLMNQYRTSCLEYFQLYQLVLQKIQSVKPLPQQLKPTLQILIRMIKRSSTYEKTRRDNDGMMRGVFYCAQQLIEMDLSLASIVVNEESDLAENIVKECLFGMNKGQSQELPKCKNFKTRQSAFALLVSIQNVISKQQEKDSSYGSAMPNPNIFIEQFFQNGFWRTKSKLDWNIIDEQEREQDCPVGLKNLGCTCYMNSLIQQIFMIREFSDGILKIKPESSQKEYDPIENILYQLQQIFLALKDSQRQYYDPRNFCRSFKDLEGEIMNVMQQMDVDEFFGTLMDRLEHLLKPSKNEFLIKNVFEGQLSNELIGTGGGCTHTSERAEPFLALQLPAKGKKNLSESLSSFVQGEMLEGDNAFFCEKCDKKVPTLKRQSIKTLPNQLIIVLKRFHFDLDVMQKIKINSYCEFPDKLNLKQFTHSYLVAQDKQKLRESKPDEEEVETQGEGSPSNQQNQKQVPEEYYNYKLKGVVIHQGTSDSGHYYSLIKQGDEKWLEFNDTSVRSFEASELAAEAFGGEDEQFTQTASNFGQKGQQNQQSLPNKNAYLLFYEKESFFDDKGNKQKYLIDQSLINDPQLQCNNENVQTENLKLHLNKYLFSFDLAQYALELLGGLTQVSFNKQSYEISKFILKYYFFCRQRSLDRGNIPSFRQNLGKILSKSPELSAWFVSNASHESFLREIFLDCWIEDMKYLSAGILMVAIDTVAASESSLSYDIFQQKSPLISFAKACIYFVTSVTATEMKLLDQFNRVFCRAGEVSFHLKRYLIQQKIIGRLQYLFIDNKLNVPSYPDINSYKSTQETELTFVAILSMNQATDLPQTIEEYLDNKERNKKLIQLKKNCTYLIKLHSILLRSVNPFSSITISEKHTLSLPRISHQIEKDEIEVFNKVEYIKRITPLCFKKLSRNQLAQSQAYLTIENLPIFEEFLNNWSNVISDPKFDDQDVKFYFVFLKNTLLIADSHANKRGKIIVNRVSDFIRGNYKYFYANSIAVDSLIKFASLSKFFAIEIQKELQTNKDFVKCIEYYLHGTNNLYQSLNGKMSLFRDEYKQIQINFQYFQKVNDLLKSQASHRKNKIIQIQNDKITPLEYDSDEDDYSEKVLKIGDKIEIRMDNEFQKMVVVDELGDLASVQSGDDKNQIRWIKYDDEQIVQYEKAAKYYQYAVGPLHS